MGKTNFWAVIIMSLLFLGSCAVTWMHYTDAEKLRADVKTKDAAIAKEKDNYQRLYKTHQELSERVGWTSNDGDKFTNQVAVDETLETYYRAFSEEYKKFQESTLRYRGVNTLEAALVFYQEVAREARDFADQYKQQYEGSRVDITALQTAMNQRLDEMSDDLAREKDEWAVSLREAQDELAGTRTQRDTEKREKDDVIRRLEQSQADYTQMVKAKDRDIAVLKAELDKKIRENRWELTALEVMPDGKVEFVSEDQTVAYINLGSKHKVRRGMVFQVYRERADGTRIRKGWVEVKEIMDTMQSEVRIVETATSTTRIQPDDLIANPVFEANRTYHIAIVADPDPGTGLTRQILIALIEENGGIYDSRIDGTTDFVIVAADPNTDPENWTKAQDLRKEVISIKEFMEFFVGRTE